jgi:hypothetical protein
VTDDEEQRARQSDALAAARTAERDDDRQEHGQRGHSAGRAQSPQQRADGRQRGADGRRQQNGKSRRQKERGQTAVERVSAVDHDAALVTAFEHDGYDCELGQAGDDFFGFVRVPPGHDRLHLMWELDVPGEFGYGPDADGWVGFDTRPVDRELSPREAAMALAGLAAQVADRSRSVPK